ncbi:hypothetical protein [Halorubrum sp. 48-1-W]|uniref:hypothetical protein n=1 Tax=Halorubrum sp. 48-1-W TaxID=2249761 RepID=UPI001F5479DD|nr:hypothetical protein [Halorubrum sp. 48-1-W]
MNDAPTEGSGDGSDDATRDRAGTPTGDPARDRRQTETETNRDRSTTLRDIDAMTDTPNETETAPTTASTNHPETDGGAATDGGTAEDDPEPAEEGRSRLSRLSSDDLRGLLDRVGLAALVLLALIAGWSFYSQTGRAIRTWLDPAYQPIALAVFNLAVLFVALAGVTHQLHRIRVGDDEDPEPSRESPDPSREDSDPSRTAESRASEDR